MDIPKISSNLMIQPNFDIDQDQEIHSDDVQEVEMIAREEKPKLKDDELFEKNNIRKTEEDKEEDKEEVKQESIQESIQEKEIVKEEVKEIKKPVKKKPHPRKGKKLSQAHREALARGRAKALENRRKKAQIRKQLKKEKKIEKNKAVEYEYQRFQTEKKKKEIERKNILLNEKIDLNSVGKFFDLMDKYERLKTQRKNEYYKEKLKLKEKKYNITKQNINSVQSNNSVKVNQVPQRKYKYGHLWGIN